MSAASGGSAVRSGFVDDLAAFPEDLRRLDQWVCWRLEEAGRAKPAKVPYTPGTTTRADTTDSATWGSFEAATAHAARDRGLGVGFVFSSADGFVGVDLDHCRNPDSGELEPWAADIVERLASYTEVSPSGIGLHIIVQGELRTARRRRGAFEVYDASRYFTVTGEQVSRYGLRKCQDDLDAVCKQHLLSLPEEATESAEVYTVLRPDLSASDRAVRDLIRRGAYGSKAAELFDGRFEKYASQSEADLALSSLLVAICGGNHGGVDRLFRHSGLMRDKWDEQRGALTYGATTVAKVSPQEPRRPWV